VAILLRRRFVALLSTLVLLVASSAAIASPADVINDLNDNGTIQRCHSLADYDEALKQLPPDSPQYSFAPDIIAQAKIDHVCAGAVTDPGGDDSNTAGYVVWGVVGAAIAIAAALGSVLARRSRRDDHDQDA
jgi:hypothetical protein